MGHDFSRGRNQTIQLTPDPNRAEEPAGRGALNLPAGYLQFYGMGGASAAPIQRKEGDAGAAVESASSGSGQRMPEEVQGKFEKAFGHDFSGVRVHESGGPQAVGALAYTQGSDIHFAPGLYAPQSQAGQELLGHELTHVVQQSEGRVSATTQRKGVGVNDDHGLEREADQLGARAARGESVARSGISDFQGAHSAGAIREGQGRVLGGGVQQHKKDSSGVLQCYGGGGGGGAGGAGGGAAFAPAIGKKVTQIKGATGDWTVNAGLVKLPTASDSGEYEIDIDLKLNEKAKASKNVRFVQTVRRGTTPPNWATKATDPGMTADRASRATADGFRVDRADPSADKTPFYGHNMGGAGGTLQNTSTATPGQFGGSTVHLWDKPSVSDPLVLEFSSNAMDETSGVTYGALGWGFQYNSAAKSYVEETPRILADGDPRLAGQAAAYKKWNQVYGPTGTRDTNVNAVPIAPTLHADGGIQGNDGVMPSGDTRVA